MGVEFDYGPIVWRPSEDAVRHSRLGLFLKEHGLRSLGELRQRASQDPAWFWDAVVKMLDWPFASPYQQVLDMEDGIQWPRWFVGGTSNLALAALDRHVEQGRGGKAAIIEETEAGAVRCFTYTQLKDEADRLAWGLESLNVASGDRVAIYLPMGAEAVIAMLAAAKIGAVIVPIFSGYGAPATATRLKDSEASVVITADGFYRRGSAVLMKAVSDAAVAESQSVRHQIVVRRLGVECAMSDGRDVWWDEAGHSQRGPYPTRMLPSEAPLLLIYTSGTTGKPKGALHPHLGFPLKAAQDLWHAFDLREDDIFFWYTDMGWMMGPWMVYGGLITGSTLVLYDGTPDYPTPARLWDMIDRHRVSVFGISPTAIRGLMAHGDQFVDNRPLDSLRILGSSGEPWNPDPWMWFFEKVGHRRCPIINYSGGTEVSGGIVSAFATEPQKACAFNGPIPGMAADVVDEEGQSTQNQVGELVIRAPWPGMTRGFWRDRNRYLEAYWQRWPDTWVHGDFAYIDSDGFWYILGRSDDTIKVAGKRLGPAEVESVLVSHPEVVEAAAIGVPDAVKGESLVCFVVAVPGAQATDLEEVLRDFVAQHMGKALRPRVVHVVGELPKTRNGKVVRRAIKSSYLGRDPGDISSIENVGALNLIRGLKSS
jgi:acetyl-CoA synthetase